jgi:hypothetical protein
MRVPATLSAVAAVLRRPSLWPTAARQVARLAPSRWWARPPYLPVPAAPYLRFRRVTQYGDPAHPAEPDDVVSYLQWCRQWGRVAA